MIKRINNNDFIKHEIEIKECLFELKNGNMEDAEELINNMKNYICDNTAIIYVNINNNSVNGFIWGYYINENTIHINYFIVLNEYRRCGIGKKLLYTILNEFNDSNFELLVHQDNENAIKLYEKYGFIKELYDNKKYKMKLERII